MLSFLLLSIWEGYEAATMKLQSMDDVSSADSEEASMNQ